MEDRRSNGKQIKVQTKDSASKPRPRPKARPFMHTENAKAMEDGVQEGDIVGGRHDGAVVSSR